MADSKKMIRMDFKAYLADIEKLYDTTIEQVAKDEGMYNEEYHYQPMVYVVGSGRIFPAIDKALETAEIGKEIEISVPCEEAAGPRNPQLIEVYPIRDFYKQEINPYPGLQVSLGDKSGLVVSVGAGRVKVDFNNALAGHDLLYKITVTEVIEDPVEKAKAIVELNFGNADGFEFAFCDEKVSVTIPDAAKFNQRWPVARLGIVSEIRSAFGVDTVEFIEIWSAPKKEETKE
jgi:FKBP-type peptidyl-prolyl cis-trans isomerase 2